MLGNDVGVGLLVVIGPVLQENQHEKQDRHTHEIQKPQARHSRNRPKRNASELVVVLRGVAKSKTGE